MSRHDCHHLLTGFKSWEKLLMRLAFYGYLLIGFYAIYIESVAWGLGYLLFCGLGMIFLVLYGLCANCPYPYQFSDCLFLPYNVIKRLYKYRGGNMTRLDKIGFMVVFAGTILIPQFWLINHFKLLCLFWILALPICIAFPIYYCRRCRHFNCPLNKVNSALQT